MTEQSLRDAQQDVTGDEQLPRRYLTRSAGKQKANEEIMYVSRAIVAAVPVLGLSTSLRHTPAELSLSCNIALFSLESCKSEPYSSKRFFF